MRVKICGITNLDDALAAVECGADALGFVFVEESPRHVTSPTVREIVAALPPFVTTVGVFTSGTETDFYEAIETCGIDLIQFHYDVPRDILAKFIDRAIEVIRVKERQPVLPSTLPLPRAYLLDRFDDNLAGGSGMTFNWTLAPQAEGWGAPIVLSGGLTPDNVQAAIAQVRPYGVDVSSGVESKKGKKDINKMKSFIRAAKGY